MKKLYKFQSSFKYSSLFFIIFSDSWWISSRRKIAIWNQFVNVFSYFFNDLKYLVSDTGAEQVCSDRIKSVEEIA